MTVVQHEATWAMHAATGLLAALLLAVAWIDLRTQRIPDPLNAVIAIAGLTATWVLGRDLVSAVLGMLAGFAMIYFANAAYRAWRRRDGIGRGDAKLLAAAGAWVGWIGLPFVVLLASAVGIVGVMTLVIAGRRIERADALPFGPFLCIGVFAVWLTLAYA